jgi:hypothetical protein
LRPEPTGAVELIGEWAEAICAAGSAHPDDLSAALGIDLATARSTGLQWNCPPPPGLAAVSLILDVSTALVASVEVWPETTVPVERFTERFGPSRTEFGTVHGQRPTLIFDDIAPARAPRTCALLIRPTRRWPDEQLVDCVTLHLR